MYQKIKFQIPIGQIDNLKNMCQFEKTWSQKIKFYIPIGKMEN